MGDTRGEPGAKNERQRRHVCDCARVFLNLFLFSHACPCALAQSRAGAGTVRARTGRSRGEEVCVGVCVSNRQGEIERLRWNDCELILYF